FMSILPKTLIVVLASSLFVALIINPPFIANFMEFEDIKRKINWKRSLKIAAIYTIVAVLFYVARIYLLGNLLMTVALLYILNFTILRPLARWFQTRFLVWLENLYTHQLKHALTGNWPYVYFGGTFIMLILSTMFYFGSNPRVVFFPDTDPQTIYVTMELPI